MKKWKRNRATYGLGDIVDNNGTVGIPVIHGSEGLVSFLACRIPDLKLHCGVLIERDRLRQEGGTDCGFSVRVELVLPKGRDQRMCLSSNTDSRLFLSYLDKSQHYRTLSDRGFTWEEYISLCVATQVRWRWRWNAVPRSTSLNCANRLLLAPRAAGGPRVAMMDGEGGDSRERRERRCEGSGLRSLLRSQNGTGYYRRSSWRSRQSG